MEKIEELTVKTMYRTILKAMKTYPSSNRAMMREAIVLDVRDWAKIEDETEKAKALKKLKMLYGHVYMWTLKMEEVRNLQSYEIEKPLPFKDINRKKDKDFVYF